MAQTWPEIRAHFARAAARLQPMYNLVLAIEQSPYAAGLFGWTNKWDLCIQQTPHEHFPNDQTPFLKIALIGDSMEFRYIDTPLKHKQWSRQVPCEDAFRRLELFLDQLHWFVEVHTPNRSDG